MTARQAAMTAAIWWSVYSKKRVRVPLWWAKALMVAALVAMLWAYELGVRHGELSALKSAYELVKANSRG